MSDAFVADDNLVAALNNATGPLTVLATNGKVIGYVTPARPTAYALKVPFTDEEIERIAKEPDGKLIAAAEVEAKIRELKCTR